MKFTRAYRFIFIRPLLTGRTVMQAGNIKWKEHQIAVVNTPKKLQTSSFRIISL